MDTGHVTLQEMWDDRETLRAIYEVMDGEEWSPDTLDAIAELLLESGRTIHEPGFYDIEEN